MCHLAAKYGCEHIIAELVAAGADFDAKDEDGVTPRQIARSRFDLCLTLSVVTDDELDAARRRIDCTRLDLVRKRAFQVCLGLQQLRLDALQMCEVLVHACIWCRFTSGGRLQQL